MKENISMLKKWFGLVKPSKKETAIQFGIRCIMIITSIVAPFPAAKVIVSLTEQNYRLALIYLTITFALSALHRFVFHYFYMSTARGMKDAFLRLQDKIYDKLCSINKNEINNSSKEKLLNVLYYNAFTSIELIRLIPERIASLIKVILILIVVSLINVYVGLGLIVIAILNYLILNYFNTKRAYWIKKSYKANDKALAKISSTIDRKDLITDLNIEKKLKKEYLYAVEERVGEVLKNQWFWGSAIENWFTIIYMFLIYLATFGLIILLAGNTINLTLYLIVVPYVKEFVTNTNNFLNILKHIKQGYVSSNRVKTFLNSDDRELINFGNNTSDDILGNISFDNVTYKNDNKNDSAFGSISDISFNIKTGTIAVIKGAKQSGKRQIFYILNRYIKQESGNVLLDDISIYDYAKKTYKTNVSSLTYKPSFLTGTIMHNLKIIESNSKKVTSVCKKIGIHEYIEALPKGYNTYINKNLKIIPLEKQFLIALARTVLTKSEVIMIYEFPVSLSDEELKNIKNVLLSLKEEKTIIIFTAQEISDGFADNVIEIIRGRVR